MSYATKGDTAPRAQMTKSPAGAGESMSALPGLVRQLLAELDGAGARAVREPVAPALLDELARRYGLPPAYRELLTALGGRGFALIPGPFRELVVYAAPELDAAQVGFRGSRLGDDSFVAPHGWHRGWVVIAADAGDPYFIDIAKADQVGGCPVYTAMHGTGTWEPILAASSLEQFLRILRVWLRIVVAHHDPANPDEPLDEPHTRRLAAEIAQIDPAAADHWAL